MDFNNPFGTISTDTPHIRVPFESAGIGSRLADGEVEIVVAYAFADDSAAEEASAQIDDAFRTGIHPKTNVPLSEQLLIQSIDLSGRSVVAVLTLAPGETSASAVKDLLWMRLGPFVYIA